MTDVISFHYLLVATRGTKLKGGLAEIAFGTFTNPPSCYASDSSNFISLKLLDDGGGMVSQVREKWYS